MRRPLAVLLAGLLSALLLAGCSGDPSAAPGGVDGAAGDVAVRNAQINQVPARPGDPAFPAGGTAVLTFSATNDGDATDRVLGITAPVAASTEILGDVQIPTGSLLATGYITAPDGGRIEPVVLIKGLREELQPGRTYPVTFLFERGGAVTLQLPAVIPTAGALPSAVPAD